MANSLNLPSCVWKGINKVEAEKILFLSKTNGSFLIRESESIVGGFTLCLFYNSVNHQYRILQDSSGKLSLDAQQGANVHKYDNLNDLISDYMKRGQKNGLIGPLVHPLIYIDNSTNISATYNNLDLPLTFENKDIEKESKATDLMDTAASTKSSSESLNRIIPPSWSDNENSNSSNKNVHYSRIDEDDETDEDDLNLDISAMTAQRDALLWCDDDKNQIQFSSSNKTDYYEFIYKYFSERFKQLNLSDFDGKFVSILQNYVEQETRKDAECISSMKRNKKEDFNNCCLKYLNIALERSMQEFTLSLKDLMAKIDIFRNLFGPLSTQPLLVQKDEQWNMQKILDNMLKCKNAILNLEKKAELKFAELSSMWSDGGINFDKTDSSLNSRSIPQTYFEAKVISKGHPTKIILTIDIKAGKFSSIRPGKDSIEGKNVFSHDKIEQIIKSSQEMNKLNLYLNKSIETYIFEDQLQRDYFCKLMQELKMAYAGETSGDLYKLSIFIGTWNMGSEILLHSLQPWFRCDGNGKKLPSTLGYIANDIYAIAFQETSMSNKDLTTKIKCALNEIYADEFYLVSSHSLWSLRLIIFAKSQYHNKITNIKQANVKTGIANALGNKGAVGISFNFGSTRFCFINAHLTSGSEKLKRRNQNFFDIIKGLSCLADNDISNEFHYLFFFGDINYRLEDLEPNEIISQIKQSGNNFTFLLAHDQLNKCKKNDEVFSGFDEEKITFPPTYRFLKGSKEQYAWQKFKTSGIKINVPSWCDRILWRIYPSLLISNTSYGSMPSMTSSDHKPVFSTFDLNLIPSNFNVIEKIGEVLISITEVVAEIRTTRSNNFILEFSSSLLNNKILSKQNFSLNKKDQNLNLQWFQDQLPNLPLTLDDLILIQEHHLRISIKTADLSEYIGDCVVSLKSTIASQPLPFIRNIIKFGENIGTIRVFLHLISKDNKLLLIKPRKFNANAANIIYNDTEIANFLNMDTEVYKDQLQLKIESEVNKLNKPSSDNIKNQSILPMAPISSPILKPSTLVKPQSYNFQTNILKDFELVNIPKKLIDLDEPVLPVSSNISNTVGISLLIDQNNPSNLELPSKIIPTPASSILKKKPLAMPRIKNQISEEGTQSPSKISETLSIKSNPISVSSELGPTIYTNNIQTNTIFSQKSDQIHSIEIWLNSFGMGEYANILISNGWDNINFFTDLTREDLISIGITNLGHIQIILDQIHKQRNT